MPLSARWRWWRKTTAVHLPLDGLHASGALDDVVDELGGLLVPHLSLADSSFGQQLPQVRVQVVWIPAHVRDVLKSAGCPYVRLGDFGALFLVLILLVPLSFAAQERRPCRWRRGAVA